MPDGPRLVVVSCDPGVTCGWAVHQVPAKQLLAYGVARTIRLMRSSVGQIRGGSTSENVDRYLDLCRQVYNGLLEEDDLFVMVSESFQLQMMSSDPDLLEPVRFNAILGDRLRGTGQEVVYQTPSDAKVSVNDARLALWGLLDKTRAMGHARDAMRHGLLYMKRWVSHPHVRLASGWEG